MVGHLISVPEIFFFCSSLGNIHDSISKSVELLLRFMKKNHLTLSEQPCSQ